MAKTRALPAEALKKGLALDAAAARILTQNGVDVGIKSFGEPFGVSEEYYPQGDEKIRLFGSPQAYRLSLSPDAQIISTARSPEAIDFPVSYFIQTLRDSASACLLLTATLRIRSGSAPIGALHK